MEHIWSFFAFPLNLLLALLWLVSWGMLWKNRPESKLVRWLLSPYATILSISLLSVVGLWIGFSGNRDFVQSIPFVIILLFAQTVIWLITLRGFRRNGNVRWRFLLIHLGLLLALGAGFWGSPDSSELRVKLVRGQETRTAYKMDGSVTPLDFAIRMDDYKMTLSDDGKPSYYEAIVAIDDAAPEVITVNHPYSVSLGEDVYLASVSEGGCVLQIVREPWRYFALVGIIMLLAGAFMLFIHGPKR